MMPWNPSQALPFDSIGEIVADPLVSCDETGVIEACNAAFALFVGADRASVPGRGLVDFLPDNLVDVIVASYTPDAGEMEVTLAGHAPRAVSYRRAFISDGDGNRTILCRFTDITKQKWEREQIRMFNYAVENSPASIVITDRNGTIEYVNRKFTEVTGYALNEAVGQNPRILKSGRQHADYYREMWETILAGRSWYGEFCNVRKDGSLFWEIASIGPVIGIAGEISHFIAVKENITYLKEIEEGLRASDSRTSAILNAVPDLMFRVDTDGRLLDTEVAAKVQEIFPDAIAETARPVIARALEDFDVKIFEYPVYFNKKLQYYEARFIAAGDDEVIAIIRNISDRVAAEEQLKKARDDAEAANRAKGEFLANMSHEIRTPLNSILGFIELLKLENITGTQAEYLGIVSESAASLLGIINDILDFSKIESGRFEIEAVPFNPRREFESVIDLFTVKAQEKRIEFLSFVDPALPPSVAGDPLRIKQVLANLLSNAVKFTPAGKTISVEVLRVGDADGAARIRFTVADTGIGIPERKRDIIFSAFSQVDSSVTRRFGGTGLGLSISSNLVRMMGGELALESEPGKGSSFFFELALPHAAAEESESLPEIPPSISAVVLGPDGPPGPRESLVARYLTSLRFTWRRVTPTDPEHEREPDVFVVFGEQELDGFVARVRGERPEVPAVAVVGSMGEIDTLPRLHARDRVVSLPLGASKLYNALADAVGIGAGAGAIGRAASARALPALRVHALVAEDNAVNQKLMLLMLKQFGATADIASNGLDAFDRYRKGRYDVVFMDMHMPVTDGVEAARMILDYEKVYRLQHVPIVALTAKMMRGGADELLAMGMDEYLPKPVSLAALEAVLVKFCASRDGAEAAEAAPVADAAGAYSFDDSAAELGIGVDALREIVREFMADADETMAAIDRGIADGSHEAVYQAAHRLKGAAANLRFRRLADALRALEAAARAGDAGRYRALVDGVINEFGSVRNDISK